MTQKFKIPMPGRQRMSIISAFGRWRQQDGEFEANSGIYETISQT